MPELRLLLFDVDGTLVDSQAEIMSAMQVAFDRVGLALPNRADVLSTVGLSLTETFQTLIPQADAALIAAISQAYKTAYYENRMAGTRPVLFDGIDTVIRRLAQRDDLVLGVATGKSRRGINALIDMYDWQGVFVTVQVSDDHPSKPSPSMILAALGETGVDAHCAVMIGDTEYDMQMAQSAGVHALGVSWGYHDHRRLQAAQMILDQVSDIETALNKIWE